MDYFPGPPTESPATATGGADSGAAGASGVVLSIRHLDEERQCTIRLLMTARATRWTPRYRPCRSPKFFMTRRVLAVHP